MPDNKNTPSALVLLISCFITTAPAQISDSLYKDSLCAYAWSCKHCMTVLECINPAKWNDTIIDVPDNRTIISKNGLKLCLEDRIIPAHAEIIYIMDLSSSMNPGFGPDAGDPFKKRPWSLYSSFQYQIDSLQHTLAGYIGFHSFVETNHRLKPVKVNAPAGISSLHNKVTELMTWVEAHENDAGGCGTNYQAAIDTAIKYFSDPTIVHDPNKAIIFISDSEPDSGLGATSSQINFLCTNYIRVNGIFLGTVFGIGLDSMCRGTGGSTYLAPPSGTDTIITLLKTLKNKIERYYPVSLTITNHTLGVSSQGASFFKPSDTVWQTALNKPLPLKSNLNTIQVNSLFSGSLGNDTTLTFKFTLNVGGDTVHTPCCAYCWHRTHINISVNNVPADTLSSQNNNYTLKLFYYGIDDTPTQIKVHARTIIKGDSDTITMTKPLFDGLKWIFTKTVPFAVIAGNPIYNNGITESALHDEVTFYWKHTLEPLDTAFARVAVVSPSLSSNGFLPLKNRIVTTLQKKGGGGTAITIQLDKPAREIEASVITLTGKKTAYSKDTHTKSLVFNNLNPGNGVYLLKISADNETVIRKILITD